MSKDEKMSDEEKRLDETKMEVQHTIASISSPRYIIIYAISLAIALGFNDLANAIFHKIGGAKWKNEILPKVVYVIILFLIALLLSYLLAPWG